MTTADVVGDPEPVHRTLVLHSRYDDPAAYDDRQDQVRPVVDAVTQSGALA